MEFARYLVAFVAVFNFGGFVADAVVPATSRQHIYNPKWPPHAKFHNGQGMLMGMGLGSLSLVLLFAVHPLTLPVFCLATAIAGLYFACMLGAPFFPGTAWSDPEFEEVNRGPWGMHVQQFISLVLCTVLGIALILAFNMP